jgi:bacteriocin biosynthesis cyclodehydratase domain-containing protein
MYQLSVVGVGRFGTAVAAQLPESLGEVAVRTVRDDSDLAHLPAARCYLLVAGRPVTRLSQRLDRAVHDWRASLLPVVVEDPYLRVGPLVTPGRGACLTCYHTRVRQHGEQSQADAIEAYHRANPAADPVGHPPTTGYFAAEIAAGIVRRLLAGPPGADGEAGSVRHVDLLSLQMRRSEVVGVHGCPRCGLGTDETTRGFRSLLPLAAAVAVAGEENHR